MTKKNNIVKSLSALAIATSVLAFGSAYATPLQSGFFVGAGLSSNWLQLNSSRNVTFHNMKGTALPTINFSSYGKTALGAQVKVGYQKIFTNHFLLGAQLSYDMAHPTVSAISTVNWPTVPTSFQAQAKLKGQYAFSVLFGHTITPSTAIYGSVGIAYAPTYYNFYKIGQVYIQEHPRNKGLWGPRVGVGVMHQLSKHLILGLSYSYTFYRSTHYSEVLGSNPMNPSQFTTSDKSYHMHAQQAVVSLSYIF